METGAPRVSELPLEARLAAGIEVFTHIHHGTYTVGNLNYSKPDNPREFLPTGQGQFVKVDLGIDGFFAVALGLNEQGEYIEPLFPFCHTPEGPGYELFREYISQPPYSIRFLSWDQFQDMHRHQEA